MPTYKPDKQLRDVQLIQLEMLREVKGICQKNDIEFFLVAGTLLGAVRHSGFIPWDDDLDIGMTKDNYIKFLKIAPDYLKNDFFLQNYETDNNFGAIFSKIRKKNTLYTEKNASNSGAKDGIFIDIFCFSDTPEKQNLFEKQMYIYKRLLLLKQGYIFWDKFNFKKNVLYKSLEIISKLISKKKLISRIEKIIFFENINSTKCVNYGGAYNFDKEIMKKSSAENIIYLKFENEQMPVPSDYQSILENIYGDFMKYPPMEERNNRHGIINIKF